MEQLPMQQKNFRRDRSARKRRRSGGEQADFESKLFINYPFAWLIKLFNHFCRRYWQNGQDGE